MIYTIELPDPPSPKHTIADALAAKMLRMSCVYFVWQDGKIVYIGRCEQFHSRWSNHHKPYPPDTLISWVEFQRHEIYLNELIYIAALKPKDNNETKKTSERKRGELCLSKLRRTTCTASSSINHLATSR
jgi:hypothetical protein